MHSQKNDTTAVKENTKVENNVVATEEFQAYESPRILTHSAQQLEKASLKINACTSFLP